jgi:hypothetical protein
MEQVRNTLFCTMRNIHEPSQKRSALESDSFPFKCVFETLAWVTRRYFEISLFSYLQKAANRLGSVSGKELSEIAANFLQVLITGLSDTLDPDYLQLASTVAPRQRKDLTLALGSRRRRGQTHRSHIYGAN